MVKTQEIPTDGTLSITRFRISGDRVLETRAGKIDSSGAFIFDDCSFVIYKGHHFETKKAAIDSLISGINAEILALEQRKENILNYRI